MFSYIFIYFHIFIYILISFCGKRCLATLNKFHKIQQNEKERIRGIGLKNIYMGDFDID